jgi:hypothetical protein
LTGSVEVDWLKGEKPLDFPKLAELHARKVRSQAARPSKC